MSDVKNSIVEARLHWDAHDESKRPRIRQLVADVAKSRAQPIYVILDPATETEIARWQGAPLPNQTDDFREFLRLALP